MAAEKRVSVLSWNILARDYTHYNWEFHGSGHKKCESLEQTAKRYERIVHEMEEAKADVVLLQEASLHFLEHSTTQKLLAQYHQYTEIGNGISQIGTVVLIRKTLHVDHTRQVICVPITSSSQTGGSSKSAFCVGVPNDHGSRLWAVSIHTMWDGDAMKRLYHLGLLRSFIQKYVQKTDAVIIGGDFNCDRYNSLHWKSVTDAVSEFQLVDLGQNVCTGLTGDFRDAICIDHIFYYGSFIHLDESSIVVEKGGPSNPYENTMRGSDHSWIKCVFFMDG